MTQKATALHRRFTSHSHTKEMDQKYDTYIAWLKDAHAMEMGLITVLDTQIGETNDYPVIQERLRSHLEETQRHAELMEECVERNGGSVSTSKDVVSKMSAFLSGLGTSMMDDALVKNLHNSYAAEHFEIAAYTIIREAATIIPDPETARVCDTILEDEERMADWLITQLPMIVREHVKDTDSLTT